MKYLIAALGLVVAAALPANAQQVNLKISGGRVTLDATNVPARVILAEWARIGGTKIVGAEKITGAPLTLKLVDMPERQALDIILRNVAGFIAAPRRVADASASSYDRILIMATSTVAAPPAPAGNAGRQGVPGMNGNQGNGAMNGLQRFVPPPRPPNLAASPADGGDADDAADDADTGVTQPVFTFPAPQGVPASGQPTFVPMQPAANSQTQFGTFGQPTPGTTPTITLQPGANGPTIYNFTPNSPTSNTSPQPSTTPFGATGASRPGVIQLPPQPPPQPPYPTTTTIQTRPPGQQ
jgi:hypothetical protein